MPAKKKAKTKKLRTYPSVVQMVAHTSPPQFAVKYLADMIHTQEQKIRRIELKLALLISEAQNSIPGTAYKLAQNIRRIRLNLALPISKAQKGRRQK
jgi:hypothetical protein